MQGGGWMVLGEGSLLVRVFVRFGYYYYQSPVLKSPPVSHWMKIIIPSSRLIYSF